MWCEQSSPVHPVSESRGVARAPRTKRDEQTEILVSNIGCILWLTVNLKRGIGAESFKVSIGQKWGMHSRKKVNPYNQLSYTFVVDQKNTFKILDTFVRNFFYCCNIAPFWSVLDKLFGIWAFLCDFFCIIKKVYLFLQYTCFVLVYLFWLKHCCNI